MIKAIYYMILIFLYYMVCICLYILYQNHKNKKLEKNFSILKEQIKENILDVLDELNSKEINEDKLFIIRESLKSKNYRMQTINYLLELPNREEAIKLVKETDLLEVVLKDKENDEYDKAYKIYIIGEFRLDKYLNYLIEGCDDNHMSVQINSIKSLAKLGDVTKFIDGLSIILGSSSLIHEKIVIDVICNFNGDIECLNRVLEKKLIEEKENDEVKIIILNYFTNPKIENVKRDIFKFLTDENTSKELKISAIKYFMTVKYAKARIALLNLLHHENWEIRAMSASALKIYNDDEVILNLKKSVKDKEWYVRQNSARSLYYLAQNKNDLIYIINSEDKYASDSILSILSEENIIQEYLLDIKSLEVLKKIEDELMVECV